MDKEAWQATVNGVAKSQLQLSTQHKLESNLKYEVNIYESILIEINIL